MAAFDLSRVSANPARFDLRKAEAINSVHLRALVRVAVTGHTVSPPLYESMELLGRDRSLRRLRTAVHFGRGD